MSISKIALAYILALAYPAHAANWWNSPRLWSTVALAVATAADTQSSIGRRELNPILARNGQFTAQSATIKIGIVGSVIVTQAVLVRRHPAWSKPFTYSNFAAASFTGAAAVRNWKLK